MCKFTDRQLDNRAKKLKDLQSQADALKAEIDSLKAEIIQAMEIEGPFKTATDHYKFNYFETVKQSVDGKRLSQDMPDVYEQYRKESRYMTLKVTVA